jgi:predicted aldo/keto reductase-like oxidoreductase
MTNDASRISRREFVYQTGVAAGASVLTSTAPAWAAASAGDELPRRALGRTGVEITALTLGTAPCGFAKPHSPRNVADCVSTAIDLGITAIDTAPAYDCGEEGVGLGLGQRRKEVFLSTKVLADTIADAEKSFSNSLKVLKTDCVDLAYFHHVGDRKVDIARNPDGVFTWLLKQKQAGKCRFVGISGHNRPAKFVGLLESGEVEVLLVVVNFVDRHTYKFEENILPLAQKHKTGIVAMKVFGGSRKMNYADPQCPPELDVKYLDLAVRYALSVPGVTTLNIGVHNPDQIRRNVQMVKQYQPLAADELAQCLELGKKLAPDWGTHFGPLARAGRCRSGLV